MFDIKSKSIIILLICLLTSITIVSCSKSHECEGGDWIVETEASCSTEGLKIQKCIHCDTVMQSEIITRTEHELSGSKSEMRYYENECPDYVNFKSCNNCDYTETIESVKVHDYQKITVMSTCSTLGYDSYTCKKCGDSYTRQLTYYGGHTYSDEFTSDANYHWHKCKNCDSIKTKIEHIENEDGICIDCGTAVPYTDGVIYSLSDDGSYAVVTGYNGSNKRVRIAPEYNGVPVTHIGKDAFNRNIDLYSISLTDNVTHIESGAFNECPYLCVVLHMDNVQYVGDNAFYRNFELEMTALPEKLEYIGENAFNQCGDFKITAIPDSVTYMGEGAFYHCQRIESIKIGDNITEIKDSTFDSCYNLKDVELGKNIISIGKSAFKDCYYIESIVLPDKLISVDDNAFANCPRLNTVHYGENFEALGNHVFSQCYKFEKITVSEKNKKYVSVDGVLYTKDLTTLVCYPCGRTDEALIIQEGVKIISDYSFYGMGYLKDLTLPESLLEIGYAAFRDCINLQKVSINGPTIIGDYSFAGCSGLRELDLSDKVTTIGEHAFTDGGFIELTIPDSITSMGRRAFSSCYYLEKLTIGSGLKNIPEGAFIFCGSYLNKVTISEGVETIEKDAFAHCYALGTVTLPNSLTSIGENAFAECNRISWIVIGSGLKEIGFNAFYKCVQISFVFYRGSVESWNSISIDEGNKEIKYKHELYIYSETKPEVEGKYWHFGENGSAVIWR